MSPSNLVLFLGTTPPLRDSTQYELVRSNGEGMSYSNKRGG